MKMDVEEHNYDVVSQAIINSEKNQGRHTDLITVDALIVRAASYIAERNKR